MSKSFQQKNLNVWQARFVVEGDVSVGDDSVDLLTTFRLNLGVEG